MIAWSTVEDAIQSWIASTTGVTTIWSQQDAPRPAAPYVALLISSVLRVGHDETAVSDNDESDGDDGEEILLTSRGPRVAVLSVQCFGGDAHGASSAVALLQRAVAQAGLESQRTLLADAGVGIGTLGAVQSIGAIRGQVEFEPRAVFEARLYLAESVEETATYVETVAITNVDDSETTVG